MPSMSSPNQFQGRFPAQATIDYFFFLLTKSHLSGDHITSSSVKTVSVWSKVLHEDALWLVFCSNAASGMRVQADKRSPGSQGCGYAEVMQEGHIYILEVPVLPSLEPWRHFDSLWNQSMIQQKGCCSLEFSFWWAGEYQKCWGVCCVISIATGCNANSRMFPSWPSCGCCSFVFWQNSCVVHLQVFLSEGLRVIWKRAF